MIKTLTPLKAIHQKCLECSAGQVNEVRQCAVTDCALYPYRFGHLPAEMPTYDNGWTEEQAERAREQAIVRFGIKQTEEENVHE